MPITKEQFFALTPRKHEVVDSDGCRLSVFGNRINNPAVPGVPGEREIVLQGEGGTLLYFGWDDTLNLIVEEESGEWFALNHQDAHVVEV